MYRDREDAARRLVEELSKVDLRDPVVLGIPRGGILIAEVIARLIGAELDAALSRKLRAPWQPELAVGAVSEDGSIFLNPEARNVSGLTETYLQQERDAQLELIARRREAYRTIRPMAELTGRSVIVTDDGIATGSTMIAALQAARTQSPHELIAAIPVGPPDRIDELARHCDRVICPLTPTNFFALSQFYHHFDQVGDSEVAALLQQAWARWQQNRSRAADERSTADGAQAQRDH